MNIIQDFVDQLRSTIFHISEGGFSVFIEKLKKIPYRLFLFILDLVTLPVSIPLVLIMRLIQPVYHIHLGFFYGGRIGHFVYDTTMAAISTNKKVGHLYLFYFLPNISNNQWAKMVKRQLNVYFLVRFLAFANSIIPGGERHSFLPGLQQEYSSRDVKGLLYHSDFEFKFSDAEVKKVKKWLKEKGWNEGDKIVCFQVRDNEYLLSKNWSYHNYRNSDIDTYLPSMELLADKGYFVMRMGKAMSKPIKSFNNKIIDFAFDKNKTDLISVWLCANCELIVSTGSGPDSISDVYRKPILHINYLPMTEVHSWSNAAYSPKKLYWKESGLLLSFNEYCEYNFFYSERYDYFGINIVDLDPTEITDSVCEVIEKIEGRYIEKIEDTELQNYFWETAMKNKRFSDVNEFIHPDARMTRTFLKSHPNWLN